MTERVDHRNTPSLHPEVVRVLYEGQSEAVASILSETESAFRSCYGGLTTVHDFREMAAKNAAWTEASQIIQTDNLAAKHRDAAARKFDRAREHLLTGIAGIERELASPITSKASLQIAGEIRAYCKALKTGERPSFVVGLINSGDEISAAAVLGGPAYLSGLDADMQVTFTRMWNEKNSPEATARLKAMRSAVDLIQRNAPLLHGAFADAVGAPPNKARALREANTAAEKAAIFRDEA